MERVGAWLFGEPAREGGGGHGGGGAAVDVTDVQRGEPRCFHLRIGAEAKIGSDQHGKPDAVFAAELGPNVVFQSKHFKATFTWFFGLTDNDPKYQPYLILGFNF